MIASPPSNEVLETRPLNKRITVFSLNSFKWFRWLLSRGFEQVLIPDFTTRLKYSPLKPEGILALLTGATTKIQDPFILNAKSNKLRFT